MPPASAAAVLWKDIARCIYRRPKIFNVMTIMKLIKKNPIEPPFGPTRKVAP